MARFVLSLWLLTPVAAPVETPVPVTETEVVAVPPAPQQAPAPMVARPAAPLPMSMPMPVAPPMEAPPNGKWMRVGGGLAIGLGAVLGVAALASYAVTDGLEVDDLDDRRSLAAISLGLGIAAVAHIGAGVPLLIIGKQRQRRRAAWEQRVRFQPGFAAGPHSMRVGLTLRF